MSRTSLVLMGAQMLYIATDAGIRLIDLEHAFERFLLVIPDEEFEPPLNSLRRQSGSETFVGERGER